MPNIIINAQRCKGCALCTDVCPVHILSLSENTLNQKGYRPAVVSDADLCIGCTRCYQICPDCAITLNVPKRGARAGA